MPFNGSHEGDRWDVSLERMCAMRTKWKKSVSIVVSACLIVSSAVFTGDFGTGSAVRTAEAEVVDTVTVSTDENTGCKYKLYKAGSKTVYAEIKGFDENYEGTDIVIPAEVGTETKYKVMRIAKEAFKGSATITSVTISEGIEEIGESSFEGCGSLKSVKIPATIKRWKEDVTTYFNGAFKDCTALTDLSLAEGLTTLGQEAFRGCTALTSVKIPSTITFFPSYVFWGCTKLTDVDLTEGITQIGYQSFRECTSLEEIRIPSTIENWCVIRSSGIMATVYDCVPFYLCTSLKKVTFAEGLKTLSGFQGVRGCPLVEELDIPASVTDIERAFSTCASLKKVTMHDGLESIGTSAFEGCESLQDVVIPDTVTKLGYRAFAKCVSLEKLMLPSRLNQLENQITNGCTKLKEVYLLAPTITTEMYRDFGLAEGGKYHCIGGSSTYKAYSANHTGAVEEIPVFSDIEAKGYSGVYDGEAHDALLETKGIKEGDSVEYYVSGTDGFQSDIPKIEEPGKYNIDILVSRTGQDGATQLGVANAKAEIRKKECSIKLKSMEVTVGEYTIEPEEYVGDENAKITYYYYKDELLTESCAKPTDPGIYYVKAKVAESDYYLAAESNVVQLTINAVEVPTQEPSAEPSTEPSTEPSAEPSTEPSSAPSTAPSAEPSTAPSQNPGVKATQPPKAPVTQAPAKVAKGSTVHVGNAAYKVTANNTVEYSGTVKKNIGNASIPATVLIQGNTYKVTSIKAGAFQGNKKLKSVVIGKNVKTIGQKAFYNCTKLKKVTFQGTAVTKVNKKAFSKTAKKITVTVPKKKLKPYKKLMKKGGISKKAKYKKK